MFNRIGIVSSRGLLGARVQHETPEEGRRTYRPKWSEYSSEEEDNSPNILKDKYYQASYLSS